MTAREFLAEQKRLADAATEGPWEADDNQPFSRDLQGIFAPDARRYVLKVEFDQQPENPADAEFIAAARTSVPRLVAALEAVLAVNTGDNRLLYGNDFEAGMAKALWMVHGAIESALGGNEG